MPDIRPPKWLLHTSRVLSCVILSILTTCFLPLREEWMTIYDLYVLVPCALFMQAWPYLLYYRIPRVTVHRPGKLLSGHSRHTLRSCAHGVEILKIFVISTAIAILYHLWKLPMLWQGEWKLWLWSALTAFCVEFVVFWNGMLCLYLCSIQLGIRWRVIGALCGLIPVAQLIVLRRILREVEAEVELECTRILRNNARRNERVCATRYPILLVHGVFFRDSQRLNYWGRIPDELMQNGATLHYGNQPSAASVRDSAHELAARIRAIVEETGCEKVNVIAHSKGGLDIRAALAFEGVAPLVASVITVNTPHRGCRYAEVLLNTAPENARTKIATAYNKAATVWGDKEPDFLAAVGDLTVSACEAFNKATAGEAGHLDGILCKSIHSTLKHATGAQLPFAGSYLIAKWFDGPNDGLVANESAEWSEDHTLLVPSGKIGISHTDIIDLGRKNIPGFDVREFYVELVSDLKAKGL